MALTAAERNRRKRERKKKGVHDEAVELPLHDKDTAAAAAAAAVPNNEEVEIEYVFEALPDAANNIEMNEAVEAVRRFKARLAVVADDADTSAVAVVSSDEGEGGNNNASSTARDEEEDDDENWSKRKLRDTIRPTVADLKIRVNRPDLVEAHDVTATDPEFLIRLKSVPCTVPVPRHWGRKRKYLQGKRGFEKQPFKLPSFLVNTGITELRDTVMNNETSMSAKQKNRARVQVKLGAIDVDYRTLYDAFFKHQTKPSGLTRFGDLYYEGKELEVGKSICVGQPLTKALRTALGMANVTSPPPWLIPMQRFGPPPSYPSLKIPGLNAPLPDPSCQYGYHPQGWGKPPIDMFGRPMYGGNPFDPPGNGTMDDSFLYGAGGASLVTSDGKTLAQTDWGALPTGTDVRHDDGDDHESSDDEMEESEEESEEGEDDGEDGLESTIPTPAAFASHTAPVDLRKTGVETPMSVAGTAGPPKQLYTVLEQKQAAVAGTAVFASEVVYKVPGIDAAGAESVLSKALPAKATKRVDNKDDDDDEEDLAKKFKF